MRISYDNVVIYRLKNISWVGMESLSNVRFAHSSGGSGVVSGVCVLPLLRTLFHHTHTHSPTRRRTLRLKTTTGVFFLDFIDTAGYITYQIDDLSSQLVVE